MARLAEAKARQHSTARPTIARAPPPASGGKAGGWRAALARGAGARRTFLRSTCAEALLFWILFITVISRKMRTRRTRRASAAMVAALAPAEHVSMRPDVNTTTNAYEMTTTAASKASRQFLRYVTGPHA